ncbi:MAG: hypothetical protein K2M78_00305 [Lachnospiraceae bacterium]|nr:hypothetical protein [Lachnospiraceae bacterium]
MIIRTFKSEAKYCYYELKSMNKSNAVILILFMILYLYCLFEGKSLSEYTSAECYIVIQIVSVYILLRMILTGISLPNNTYEIEINKMNLLQNNSIMDVDLPNIFSARILIKVLYTSVLNLLTIYLIMSALNLIVDIRNFILLSLFIILGTFHMLSIGFIINTIMIAFYLRKELVIVFEVAFFCMYFIVNKDSYIFPITILITQLSGIISNDILYTKFIVSEIGSYWGLWIGMIIVGIIIMYISNFMNSILMSRDSYGRINEK